MVYPQQCVCLLALFCLFVVFVSFSHVHVEGSTLDLFIGCNYTGGLSARETQPRYGSNFEYKLMFIDRRNDDIYYSIGGNIIRKLDKHGMVTNVAGSVRGGSSNVDPEVPEYYALGKQISQVGGFVIDTSTNDKYYLNNNQYLEKIDHSNKKALISAGGGEYLSGLGYQVSLNPSSIATNSKNEIIISQPNLISKFEPKTYNTSILSNEDDSGSYTKMVSCSSDDSSIYGIYNDQVHKISTRDGTKTTITGLTNLVSIDCVENDLYLLGGNGVYRYNNMEGLTLIAGGSVGTYQEGMNATSLKLGYPTTMVVSSNRDIYLTDFSSMVVLKIDNQTQQVTDIFSRLTSTVRTSRNATFDGIVSTVHDPVTGNVYICDGTKTIHVFDGQTVQSIFNQVECLKLAINSIGELFILDNQYRVIQIINGQPIIYAGNGIQGSPQIYASANSTSFSPVDIGFFLNGDLFISSGYSIYRIERNTLNVTEVYTTYSEYSLKVTVIDPTNDHLYIADGFNIMCLFPNGTRIKIAGADNVAARNIAHKTKNGKQRLKSGESDGESTFDQYVSPSSMLVGSDGKLYISFQDYLIRTVENGFYWTVHYVDSQEGPQDTSYLNKAFLLGRFNNALMVTSEMGNIYLLKPTSTVSCFGKSTADSLVCSGRGSCIGLNRCACQGSYSGLECQYSVCNDISGLRYQEVCGGAGTCSAPDVCTCTNTAYSGLTCSDLLVSCNGISSTNYSLVCSGKGSCVGVEKCLCNTGRAGTYCQFDFCISTWNANSDNVVCGATSTSNVEANQENLSPSQLNGRVLRFVRNPSVVISLPADLKSYILQRYPEITDQSNVSVISSIYDPTLDTSQDLLLVSPIVSISIFKQTSELISINGLPNPIVIEYNNIKIDKTSGSFNYSCMFFDTNTKSWSSSGIKSTISTSSLSSSSYTFSLRCETNHLTSFSVIDMNYKKAKRDDTIDLGGLSTGGIIALAVCLGGAALIAIVVALIVASVCGFSLWTKHKKKQNMSA